MVSTDGDEGFARKQRARWRCEQSRHLDGIESSRPRRRTAETLRRANAMGRSDDSPVRSPTGRVPRESRARTQRGRTALGRDR